MASIENKVCVVTEAGQGFGRTIAMTYAREGGKVVVADFNKRPRG